MSSHPAVSVIIPAYNVAEYIAETLESLFAQTMSDFEAIVINDGSTDETELRLEPFMSRIHYIARKNSGVMAARNAGLSVARGAYVALLDGDDIWMPEFLEVLVGMMESDRSLSAAFPNAVLFGSSEYDGRLYQDIYPVSEPVTFDRVLRRECAIFGSLVFRRSALDRVGRFDEELKGQGAEDLDLWLRMLQAGLRFGFTTIPLVRYRRRTDSLSNSSVGLLRCVISVYEKIYRQDKTTSEQRAWIKGYLKELRVQLLPARFRRMIVAPLLTAFRVTCGGPRKFFPR